LRKGIAKLIEEVERRLERLGDGGNLKGEFLIRGVMSGGREVGGDGL